MKKTGLLFLFFALCHPRTCFAEPSPAPIQVRLLSPIASYSKVGTLFEVKVIGSLDGSGTPALPVGSVITGSVRRVESIGLGLKHERASLDLAFRSCLLPGGQPVPCDVALAGIDNARENVLKGGRIQGILPGSHPHSWLGGVWYRPGSAISGRSASGLTGAGGKLQGVLAPTPIGAAIFMASRLLLFRLPNGEIELPAGTDLILHLMLPDGPVKSEASRITPTLFLEQPFHDWLAEAPAAVALPDGSLAADIINFAFLGTKEQLASAFEAAGWNPSDAFNARTFARGYAAISAMRTYPTAPVSPLLYRGRLPDLVFQKSFNSLSKRHHIRLWNAGQPHGAVWLGAATHDIAASFDWSRMTLTHRIDPNIDRERQRVLYDLEEVGCLESYGGLERPQLASSFLESTPALTDGVLVVARVRDCQKAETKGPTLKSPKRPFTTVIARRFILEGRNYFTRGNAYYWAYRGVRWTISPKRILRVASDGRKGQSSVPIVKVLLSPASPSTGFPISARPST